MSSFVDEARTESEWKPRVKCGVGKLLDSLPKQDQGEVVEALADTSISSTAIERVLARRYPNALVPKSPVIARHRSARGCNCG